MIRDLRRLAGATHDLIVVGGGLHGACIAWDASLRGLRVALIERDDFGAATSGNSLRIVHGGLRYLARGDLRRMRESIRERSTLLRIAPTLVQPLPVLVPTSGMGTHGRVAMAAALRLNDAFSHDRNQGLDPAHRLADGRLVPLDECRSLFPAFPSAGATGGALWHDARLTHPEGLTLALLRSAAQQGALVANHCAMDRILTAGGAIEGVAATDRLQGGRVEIRGRAVVVAAGPWTPALCGAEPSGGSYAFALNLELGRRLAEVAVGVRALTGAADDPVIGGRRFLFLNPQGRTTLLGTWYAPAEGRSETELVALGGAALLEEVRAACPALDLDGADVVGYQWGWLPLKAGREPGRPTALADRPRVMDHGEAGGIRRMFSVEGVKFTTARRVAEQVTDRVVAALGRPPERCRTAEILLDAGEALDAGLEASVRRAIREEMAARLPDVLRRLEPRLREDQGTTLETVARLAAVELGWTEHRKEVEIQALTRVAGSPGFAPEPAA
ncbi:MAG TPA: FAD-dependent oxidoreductase [Gemmatimonadales bacterium]|nr:FAD-dependent oxidoreductase [Gemmatimonadales bacterium]